MSSSQVGEVTLLLRNFRSGDHSTASRLMEVIYPELKKLAKAHFRHERPGHVLQPTALVHEAYFRLMGRENHSWESRVHFYAAAAKLMRRILIDYARARNSAKREGGRTSISLDETPAICEEKSADLLDLEWALSELEQLSPRQARVVELRYFTGLSVPEVARALGVNPRSVDRDWATAPVARGPRPLVWSHIVQE